MATFSVIYLSVVPCKLCALAPQLVVLLGPKHDTGRGRKRV